MTKRLFFAVCAVLVVLALCEEQPQRGGAEQQPGKSVKTNKQANK